MKEKYPNWMKYALKRLSSIKSWQKNKYLGLNYNSRKIDLNSIENLKVFIKSLYSDSLKHFNFYANYIFMDYGDINMRFNTDRFILIIRLKYNGNIYASISASGMSRLEVESPDYNKIKNFLISNLERHKQFAPLQDVPF